MNKNVVSFFQKVAASPALQQQLEIIKSLPEEERQSQLLALSQQEHLPFSVDDLKAIEDPYAASEEELAQISGGKRKVVTALGSYVHHDTDQIPPTQKEIEERSHASWKEFLSHFSIHID